MGARGRLAWTLTPGPSWAGQRWLTGSKAPDSGAAPVTFSQASRGLWEGASSERASITAYAWQGTRHGGRAGEWGAWGPPSPGQLCPRPFPAPHCPPAGPGSSREGRAKAQGAGPARRPPALPAWERETRGERAAGTRGPHKGSRGLLGCPPTVTPFSVPGESQALRASVHMLLLVIVAKTGPREAVPVCGRLWGHRGDSTERLWGCGRAAFQS